MPAAQVETPGGAKASVADNDDLSKRLAALRQNWDFNPYIKKHIQYMYHI